MDGYWGTLVLVGVLIVLNALFAGSEIALVSLREGQQKQLERRDTPSARALLRLARDPNRFLATIQIGSTLAGFLASAIAAVALAELVAPLFAFLGTRGEARRDRVDHGGADVPHPRRSASSHRSGWPCSTR